MYSHDSYVSVVCNSEKKRQIEMIIKRGLIKLILVHKGVPCIL